MSAYGLNKLIGQACISDTFQAGLMDGQRAELIQRPEFELEPDEAKALLAIQAESFADFVVAVEGLLNQRESWPTRAEGPYLGAARWAGAANTGVYFRHDG